MKQVSYNENKNKSSINMTHKFAFLFPVLLSTVGVSDQGIIVDSTGPFAGHVFDGPHYKEDLQYSKDSDMVSSSCQLIQIAFGCKNAITSLFVGKYVH